MDLKATGGHSMWIAGTSAATVSLTTLSSDQGAIYVAQNTGDILIDLPAVYPPWFTSEVNAFVVSGGRIDAPHMNLSQCLMGLLLSTDAARTIGNVQFQLAPNETSIVLNPQYPVTPARRVACVKSTYSWRERLRALNQWRGDENAGEAPRLFASALRRAETLAAYAEERMRVENAAAATILVPHASGRVQIEWTIQRQTHTHLEVLIGGGGPKCFELLWTEETKAGEVSSARERIGITAVDVISEFECFLERMGKSGATSRPAKLVA